MDRFYPRRGSATNGKAANFTVGGSRSSDGENDGWRNGYVQFLEARCRGTQRGSGKAGRLLGALQRAFQNQGAESGHTGAGALSFFADRELASGEVLQSEERQFEAILHAYLLEQPGQINLNGAFGNHQGGGDFLVLEALGEQADELSFALRQGDTAGAEEAVGEGLFEPEFAGLNLLQTFDL